jgi:hypothetical protein
VDRKTSREPKRPAHVSSFIIQRLQDESDDTTNQCHAINQRICLIAYCHGLEERLEGREKGLDVTLMGERCVARYSIF